MAKLCPDCTVIYQNANADVALQQQQFNSVMTQGAKVIVLDPVDSAAAASLVKLAQSQGVKVIAYDRPIPDVPADYYVSFDNQGIGKAISESLVKHLEAQGVAKDKGGILQINGSPTDAAAGLIRDGVHEGLAASGYKTLAEFDTPDWAPPKAQEWTSGQIQRFGDDIVGIVAANDGTGGGAIAALKAAGVDPQPPVTGNDATIAALQLIISGDQYNTISKPSEIVAAAAANVAVQLLDGKTVEPKTDALQHALRALRPGGGDQGEHQGRDLRQGASTPPPRSAPAATPRAARRSASSRAARAARRASAGRPPSTNRETAPA